MRGDLAVDEVEAALGVGDLSVQASGELGEEIAVLAGGGFGVEEEGGDLAREQDVALGGEGGDVALGMCELAGEAKQFGLGAFADGGGVDLAVIVEQALEDFGVAAGVGLIGAGHEEGEVLALGVVAGEVGVDALGDVAEEGFEGGRRVEVRGFAGFGEGGLVGLLSTLTGLVRALPGGGGVVEVDLALGDAGLEVVELRVEDADLPEVAAFEGAELRADLGEIGFVLGEGGAERGELRAPLGKGAVDRGWLEDDFGWHAAAALQRRRVSLAERGVAGEAIPRGLMAAEQTRGRSRLTHTTCDPWRHSLHLLKKRLSRIPFAGRFALLFFFLLGSIVFYPYAEISGPGYYAFRVIGALIIFLTVWAVTFSRGLLVLVVALAIPSVLQHLIFHPHAPGTLPLINRMLSIGFDVVVMVIISRHIFRTENPNSETIFGALCIYLLLGFTFASIFSAIANRLPAAFYLSPTVNLHTVPDRFDFLYFSFGTLTELGTPGITAVAPFARSVSLLEAILGVLYMAVLISRLLNAYRSAEMGKGAGASKEVL